MSRIRLLALLLGMSPMLLCAQIWQCGNGSYVLDEWDMKFARNTEQRAGKVTGGTRIIPVVVTVIASSTGSVGDISDAQVESQLPVLNAAYSGGYGGVNTNIQFCLSGIIRVVDGVNCNVQLGQNDPQAKALGGSDPGIYLNVWVVESLLNGQGVPISGFTIYPKFLQDFPEEDGVLIVHSAWGNTGTATGNADFDEGKIAVHEVGHWLNLLHVFEGACDNGWTCATAGDCCCDTPPMLEPRDKCNRRRNSCDEDNPDLDDPLANYMGYTFDACRTEFTSCQSDRMNQCLDQLRPNCWFTTGDCPPPRVAWDSVAHLPSFTVGVVPNPVAGRGVIRLNVLHFTQSLLVQVYDLQGRVVPGAAAGGTYPAGTHELPLELPAAGVYLVGVRGASGLQTVRVVSWGAGR